MKKEQIYVEITNENERLRAIEILEKAGEEIYCSSDLFKSFRINLFIAYDISKNKYEWQCVYILKDRKQITLDELESLLLPKQNVLIEVQNWVREKYPNGSITLLNNEPECLTRLREHLRNDYPKGTEIIINKDEILIR